MQFNSLVFLCIFFPLAYFLFLIVPKRFRLTLLAGESVLFYYICQPESLWIYIGILMLNYMCGTLLYVLRGYNRVFKRSVLAFGILWNIAILCFYKYGADQFLIPDLASHPTGDLAVPMGISYIVFQGISMLIDISSERVNIEKKPLRAVVYLSFFANVTAGPIQKYHELKAQIDSYAGGNGADVSNGLFRISVGLVKKLIIADTLGMCVDKIWNALSLTGITAPTAWFGALCYMYQVYFDFSGYSDMAIGIASVFGLTFDENFRYPYAAKGMSDFWRRWHISLSNWFREYVYIPLGGNRRGFTWFNILLVFILTGIWHGKGMTFFLWGLYNGVLVIADRRLQIVAQESLLIRVLIRIGMLVSVYAGWIIFRAPSLSMLGSFLASMFDFSRKALRFTCAYYAERKTLTVLLVAILCSFPFPSQIWNALRERTYFKMLQIIVMAVFMIIALTEIVSSTYSPFIYLKF